VHDVTTPPGFPLFKQMLIAGSDEPSSTLA